VGGDPALIRPWLVTGAGGFIGARVLRRLAADGLPFIGLLAPGEPPPKPPKNAPWPAQQFRTVDLRDREALTALVRVLRPAAAIHLAAIGVAPGPAASAEAFVLINVLAPSVLLEALPDDAVLVQAGSMAQYEGAPAPLSENSSPLSHATLYAWSKNAAERLLGLIAARTAKRVVRARLFGVIGPGEAPHRLIPSIVAGARAGTPIELSDGAQLRDVLHVDDVAAALVRVARTRELAGKAVNIGRGEGRSIRWMAERAAQKLGCEKLLRFGALPRRRGEPQSLVADVSRLAATGWTPSMDFDTSVDRAVDDLKP